MFRCVPVFLNSCKNNRNKTQIGLYVYGGKMMSSLWKIKGIHSGRGIPTGKNCPAIMLDSCTMIMTGGLRWCESGLDGLSKSRLIHR